MFINFWYAAAQAGAVTAQPLGVRMLGQDFVLFRDRQGQAHCLSGICVHRGADLSAGKVSGDCIECPYHGWHFDGAGRCTRIPSLGPGAKFPPRARVDSYPTLERYGLVFTFLGDLPEQERPPIMAIPEWDAKGWRATQAVWEFDFDYKRSLENALDPAHNEFVHTTHVQMPEGETFTVPPLELEEHEWGTSFHLLMPGPPLHDPKMREISGQTRRGDVHIRAGHTGVSSFWTFIEVNQFLRYQYFFETPIDTGRTRIFATDMRNAMLEAKDDERTIRMDTLVMNQDARVLLGIRPVLPPVSNARETLVPSDRHAMRYRERLQEWEARGWRIDVAAAERDRLRVAYAIPSPARREVGSWTIEPIPLLKGQA